MELTLSKSRVRETAQGERMKRNQRLLGDAKSLERSLRPGRALAKRKQS